MSIIRCKDCVHRPYKVNGKLSFPDEVCPCRCDDTEYSMYPPDNFFCKNGESADSQTEARIEFRPVCSKCHTIIHEVVDCITDNSCLFNERIAFVPPDQIVPCRCSVCKTRFESIAIPTRLPFKGY